MINKIKVRPTSKGLVVLDENGRRIKYSEGGIDVTKTVHIVRLVKSGDLELIKARKAEKRKGENK